MLIFFRVYYLLPIFSHLSQNRKEAHQIFFKEIKCHYPVLAKQPINVEFCDILVLFNHSNNITRN